MIDVTLQFTHWGSAGFARHFMPPAFPARIDIFTNLGITCHHFKKSQVAFHGP
jgi:hypothetical protein